MSCGKLKSYGPKALKHLRKDVQENRSLGKHPSKGKLLKYRKGMLKDDLKVVGGTRKRKKDRDD